MPSRFARWNSLAHGAILGSGAIAADGVEEFLAPDRVIAKLIDQQNFAAARAKLLKAIVDSDRSNVGHSRRIELRLRLASVELEDAGRPAKSESIGKAEKYLREAIALAASANDSLAYLQCLDGLQHVFELRADWPALEKLVKESIRIQGVQRKPDLIVSANRYRKLAFARSQQQQFGPAAEACQHALHLLEQAYGPDHIEVANLLAETGRILRAFGDHEAAEQRLRSAIRLHRKHLGDVSAPVIYDLQQLAGALEAAGDLAGAAKEYELCLTIQQRRLGVEHIDELGLMQFSLANIYIGWGNLARARELLSEATGAFQREGGARLAVACETLAQVEENSGRYPLAIKEAERAAKAWERCGPQRAEELARNLEYRAALLDDLRKPREATWLRQRADALRTA